MVLINRTSSSFLPALFLGLISLSAYSAGESTKYSTKVYEFEVLLDSKPIGTHRFEIISDGASIERVSSTATFDVRFLGIPFYRYHHSAVEQWQGGCLQSMDATTNDNGKKLTVHGVREGDVLSVTGSSSPFDRVGCVSSYAYWNPRSLLNQNELLNPQTGEIDKVTVESLGQETILVRGQQLLSNRSRLHKGSATIDLWYSNAGEWLQLESVTEERRRIRYRAYK